MAEMLSWFGTGFGLSLGSLADTIVGLVLLGVYEAVSGVATRTMPPWLYWKDERGTL